jgi:hypothetical protein
VFYGVAASGSRCELDYCAEVAADGPPLHFRAGGVLPVPKADVPGDVEGCNDARTGMPARMLAGAMCVQRFDDSLNSAIHITYRISLRSSSMPEPRDPLLKVLIRLFCLAADSERLMDTGLCGLRRPPGSRSRAGAGPSGRWGESAEATIGRFTEGLGVVKLW